MPSIKLIMSDLHLADGHAVLDGFGDAQQAALEGLLHTRRDVEDVELIINGDCFDFLVIPPFQKDSATDAATALGKLEKVFAAHRPFFELLHEFISIPGRSVTFITGNHDIELCFEEVCTRIAEVIYRECGGASTAILRSAQDDKWRSEGGGVHFCLSCFYRPLPDVYIEHGNEYDFWNHISGIWDDKGHPLTLSPGNIPLPFGSQYVLRVGHPISVAYPYFDHFEPSMNILRQIALLSLLDPDLTIKTAERLMGMLSYPRKALADLALGEERIPARLFEHAMLDFLAFQQDIEARSTEWKANIAKGADQSALDTTPPALRQEDAMMEFLALRNALTLSPAEAIAAICTPVVYSMGEDVARGMQHVLNSDPPLRYAIAGHSHMWRIDPIRSFQPADREAVDAVASLQAAFQKSPHNGRQTYLNTGTWTTRVALPRPGEITPTLIEWLRQPDWSNVPLLDMTQFTFVMITTDEDGPSEVRLCAWEGGAKGSYRIIG